MTAKPLFIPLKTHFFEAFARGEKTSELRLYGARWNERTCPPGRAVTLSKGYGRTHRINGVIAEFHKRDERTFGSTYRAAILDLFGTLDLPIAEIRIQPSTLCEPVQRTSIPAACVDEKLIPSRPIEKGTGPQFDPQLKGQA